MALQDEVQRVINMCAERGYELQIDQVGSVLGMGIKSTHVKLTSVQKPTDAHITARESAARAEAFERKWNMNAFYGKFADVPPASARKVIERVWADGLKGAHVIDDALYVKEGKYRGFELFDHDDAEHMAQARKAIGHATGPELDATGRFVYRILRAHNESDNSYRLRLIAHADLPRL